MSDVTAHLLFKDPAASDAKLVFGASDAVPAIEASLEANLGALSFGAVFNERFSASLDCELPGLEFVATFIPSLTASVNVALPDLALSAVAAYASKTDRPVVGLAAACWQRGESAVAGIKVPHQNAQSAGGHGQIRWHQASAIASTLTHAYAETLKRHSTSDSRFNSAQPASAASCKVLFEDAARTRQSAASYFKTGDQRKTEVTTEFQECLRDRRAVLSSIFAQAKACSSHVDQRVVVAVSVRVARLSKFQNAVCPNGRIVGNLPPVIPLSPCYTPSPHLVFASRSASDGHLLFICERAETSQITQIVIPVRSAYIVLNNSSLVRSVGNVDLQALTLDIGFDADSWVAEFSATIPESSRDAVMPAPLPVEVTATMNGTLFRFIVERIGRSRSFGKQSVTISGRGIACELDGPYAPITQHMNLMDRTAQQLVIDALQFSGYEIDWGLTDWFIPAGVLSVTGSPIVVAQAVAEAAGAVLSADWSARKLHFRPRYPVKPWGWQAATPEYVIPAAVAQTENIEWIETPAYNAVFVAGEQAGVIGHVKIAGTAGDLVAPMVTHPLTTHADAARQRGVSILSKGGRRAQMQISLPILPELGIVDHGKLIEFNDGANTRRGIVRANRITDNRPIVRQTLTVEAAA